MKVGDLVKTTRARIGCPVGSLGLVIRVFAFECAGGTKVPACKIFIFSKQCISRSLSQDLEVLEATIS